MSKMTTCKTGENTIKAGKESQPKPEINHELLLFWRSNARQGQKTLNDRVEPAKFAKKAEKRSGVFFHIQSRLNRLSTEKTTYFTDPDVIKEGKVQWEPALNIPFFCRGKYP
ncbi:hypothetical protein GCE9029_00518 [Grimontia celer]|uniref:Uncharacterized protein n=1 Tax=Grimontia celer TaxID=1796497 RepID=A0A128ETN0_9GAMM|nr:hypothetical protein GCE9029_00518 [Grimontia celer]